ncbi:hypothetical protein MTO96_016791 [Rhipicephalus appendiculatus]
MQTTTTAHTLWCARCVHPCHGGNPHQKSINFLSHLNLRHRFEYDTYVDYGIDDDDALQQALEASLKEK